MCVSVCVFANEATADKLSADEARPRVKGAEQTVRHHSQDVDWAPAPLWNSIEKTVALKPTLYGSLLATDSSPLSLFVR